MDRASPTLSISYNSTVFMVINPGSDTSNPCIHPVLILSVLGAFILPDPDNEKSRYKMSFSRVLRIVSPALLELSSLTLLACVLRALHLILSVLRPVGRTQWIVLGILLNWPLLVLILIGQVLSIISGTGPLATLQILKKGKNTKGIGDVISTASFTLFVWCMYTLNDMAHNMLLPPDQVSSYFRSSTSLAPTMYRYSLYSVEVLPLCLEYGHSTPWLIPSSNRILLSTQDNQA